MTPFLFLQWRLLPNMSQHHSPPQHLHNSLHGRPCFTHSQLLLVHPDLAQLQYPVQRSGIMLCFMSIGTFLPSIRPTLPAISLRASRFLLSSAVHVLFLSISNSFCIKFSLNLTTSSCDLELGKQAANAKLSLVLCSGDLEPNFANPLIRKTNFSGDLDFILPKMALFFGFSGELKTDTAGVMANEQIPECCGVTNADPSPALSTASRSSSGAGWGTDTGA